MAGANWSNNIGDTVTLDYGKPEKCRVRIVKTTKAGYVYVMNVLTHTTYKVHRSRLSHAE